MTWRLLFMLLLVPAGLCALVSGFEYSLDNDPGPGNGIFVSVDPVEDLNTGIDYSTLSLPSGFHYLVFRAKDGGKWSLPYYQTIYRQVNDTTRPITAAEYYFDTDPGEGMGHLLTVSDLGDAYLTFDADITSLDIGPHLLFVRTAAGGIWSQPVYTLVYREVLPAMLQPVTAAEYFWDTDPGCGAGTVIPVTADYDVNVQFSADASQLGAGFHNLNIRAKSADGTWSHCLTRAIVVVTPPAVSDVVGFVWYVTGAANTLGRNLVALSADDNETIPIPIADLAQGQTYRLHIAPLAESGAWGQEVVSTFTMDMIPKGFTVSRTGGVVTFMWQPVVGASGYSVQSSTNLNSGFSDPENVSQPSWTAPANCKQCFIKVKAQY